MRNFVTDKRSRAGFMSGKDEQALGTLSRTHANCLKHTGRARPGKTAQERWRRSGSR
jgi:hypothetical protein